MTRLFVRSAMLATFLAIAPLAWGQTLLDQVEKKVDKDLKGGKSKPAATAPPAGEPSAPAERPPAGIGELPPPPAPAPAGAKPGYLGVVLNEEGGVIVEEVAKDSPAAKAGLKAGDKITSANNFEVKSVEELGEVMKPLPAGDKLTLEVVRGGKPMTIEATLRLGVVLKDGKREVVVEEVAKDSPAAKAGLKAGDKITSANKVEVNSVDELGVVLQPLTPGDKLTLAVVRGGKPMTIEATLASPPAEPAREGIELGSPLGPGAGDAPARGTPDSATAPRADAGSRRASLGITVVTFDAGQRRLSDVTARGGAMITAIRPESPAARAGLPLGGVIVAYDGAAIDTADQLVEAIRSSRPGQEVEVTYYQGGGVGVKRKTVTLAAAADPGLLGPGYGGLLRDRPALNRIERAIEGLTRPGNVTGDAPGAIGGAAAPGEGASLREEIEALKGKVEALETRLGELEAKLAEKSAPGAEAAPEARNPGAAAPIVPKEDAAPSLKPPARRPPTKAPGAKIGDE